ncbi:MAG: lysylphosphatidylglycerol synthase domain-containing protein, partial [Candidatus Fermentibacteraceae bacterium]
MKSSLRIAGFVLPIFISLGLLFLIYKETDPVSIVHEFGSADLLWAGLYFFLSSLEPLVRGVRWSLLAVPVKRSNAIRGLYISKAGNNLLPLRMGDAVRAQYIRDKDGIPYSGSAASILAESLLDLLLLSLIVLVYGVSIASVKGIFLSILLLFSLSLVFLLIVKGRMLIPG